MSTHYNIVMESEFPEWKIELLATPNVRRSNMLDHANLENWDHVILNFLNETKLRKVKLPLIWVVEVVLVLGSEHISYERSAIDIAVTRKMKLSRHSL